MILSATLSRYLARSYILNLLFMTACLWGIIYLFDTVELLRRATKIDDFPLILVLQMGLLKLPDVGFTVFPFAILFAAMFTFWQLTRRYELVVVRSAGFSVWQFLAPIVGVAVLTGILILAVFNPLSALLIGKYEQLESRFLTQRQNEIALFDEGLWLRQGQMQGQGLQDSGYAILHAEAIQMPEWKLQKVMVLFFDEEDSFLRRLDATSAQLADGQWQFSDIVDNRPGEKAQRIAGLAMPTELTTAEIEDSFSSPETLSFWQLPSYIRIMERTGFDSTRLRIHLHSLMAQPLLFAAMIFLAAAVSMRPPRQGAALWLLASGILIGFVTFFTSSFLQALGASHQIPVPLAAWSPALVMTLLGVSAMLTLEEG